MVSPTVFSPSPSPSPSFSSYSLVCLAIVYGTPVYIPVAQMISLQVASFHCILFLRDLNDLVNIPEHPFRITFHIIKCFVAIDKTAYSRHFHDSSTIYKKAYCQFSKRQSSIQMHSGFIQKPTKWNVRTVRYVCFKVLTPLYLSKYKVDDCLNGNATCLTPSTDILYLHFVNCVIFYW